MTNKGDIHMANKLVSRPARKKNAEAPVTAKTTAPSLDILIDYPKEEELVLAGHYAVRITASPEAQVELSINNGEWSGCRTSLGHYWFDWSPTDLGETVLKARLRIGAGRWKVSGERFCRVVSSKKA
jgi:hypothetical protein